jgi:uncharacterized protein YceK
MKHIRLVLSVIAVLSLTGCATILKQPNAVLDINSDPAGANVYVNGNKAGNTPLPVIVPHKRPVTLTFKKDGYIDKVYVINNKIESHWFIFDLLGGPLPLLIDATSGNWCSLEETNISVDLNKDSVSDPDSGMFE